MNFLRFFLLIAFLFIGFNFCFSQNLLFKKIISWNNFNTIKDSLFVCGFKLLKNENDSNFKEMIFFKEIKKDTILIYYNENQSSKILTKMMEIRNADLLNDFTVFLKKSGYMLKKTMGNKIGGYILTYKDKNKKEIRIYKNFNRESDIFWYRIYLPYQVQAYD
jgi:hypothetical protein